MTTTVKPSTDKSAYSQIAPGSVKKTLEKDGRLPPVSLVITPIDSSRSKVFLDRFLSYSFNSSVLIPVDTFSFTFVNPHGDPFYDFVKEGDIVTLYANDVPLSTGIIDSIEIEVQTEFGEKVTVNGRDLMSQLEDNACINVNNDPIYANATTVQNAVQALIANTRIKGFRLQGASTRSDLLFATEPGESKLSALQRLMEPINCIAWMDPNGNMIIGKPNMAQAPLGKIICSRERRESNVISMKAVRSATSIPNIMLAIWAGQENVQARVSKDQSVNNPAEGPKRLRQGGHLVQRTVVISTPQGNTPQDLSEVNKFTAYSNNLLEAYAKLEMAKHNQKELVVQVVMAGHYNEDGFPYNVDQVYQIEFDRGSLSEKMYLFQVDYNLDESTGQKVNLYFCRLGTIVADVPAKPEALRTSDVAAQNNGTAFA